jgi:hypothetical protein
MGSVFFRVQNGERLRHYKVEHIGYTWVLECRPWWIMVHKTYFHNFQAGCNRTRDCIFYLSYDFSEIKRHFLSTVGEELIAAQFHPRFADRWSGWNL